MFAIILAFGWIVCSVLVGVAAGERGRGRGGWGHFALSLLLSPLVGAVFRALLPINAKGMQARELNEARADYARAQTAPSGVRMSVADYFNEARKARIKGPQ